MTTQLSFFADPEPQTPEYLSHPPPPPPVDASVFDHVWRWEKKPMRFTGGTFVSEHRKGQACRVLSRGSLGSILVAFPDGTRHITSHRAVLSTKLVETPKKPPERRVVTAGDLTHALSFMEPWLWMMTVGYRNIPRGVKDVENRSWAPPMWIMGKRIALHASKTYDSSAWETMDKIAGQRVPDQEDLKLGSIVATAVVDSFVTASTNPWFFGKFGWILRDIHRVAPVPCRGSLGLWVIPDEVKACLR